MNDKEYTKISIRFNVSEWFVPQYANQSSSLNSSAFENESEQSSLNYFWKRDISPYKPDRIHSTTLSTDILSAIAGASLEILLSWIIVFKTSCHIWDYENKVKAIFFCFVVETSYSLNWFFMYFFIILLFISSYNSFHSQIQ